MTNTRVTDNEYTRVGTRAPVYFYETNGMVKPPGTVKPPKS